MKKLWNEFKEFAFKGNVIDMAVGVILGTAITAVVTSLVQDIIMPVLSAIIKIPSDITELTLKINNINIKYGSFLSNLINFLLMAFCIFICIKAINKVMSFRKKEEEKAAPAPKPEDIVLLEEIIIKISRSFRLIFFYLVCTKSDGFFCLSRCCIYKIDT